MNPLAINRKLVFLALGLSWWLTGCASTEVAVKPNTQNKVEEKPASSINDLVIHLSYMNKGYPLSMNSERGTEPFLSTFHEPMKNVPKESGGKRFWGELRLGPLDKPNQIPFIIDDARPGDVIMYVDADQDGDFANSMPLGNQGTGAFARELDLQIIYGSKRMPYRIWFFINDVGWTHNRGAFYARCHQRGQILIGDTTYTVVICDDPADGDYSNDPVIIDLNLDGKIQENEEFKVGNRIGNSNLILQSISPAGDEIRLSH